MNTTDDIAPTEDAASWMVRLESDASPECRAKFTAWLEQSPRNMEEFLLVTAAYEEIGRVGTQVEITVEGGMAEVESNVVGLRKKPHLSPTLSAPVGRRGSGWKWVAAVAVLSGVAILGWQWRAQLSSPNYQTATGEQRTIKLEDGSVVQLNTRSRVQIRFSAQARDIQLLEGEALFVVEQDARRPFRVATDTAVIQALGTQFNVYKRQTGTTVSVVQGRVRVSTANGNTENSTLAAGEQVQVASGGRIEKRSTPQIAQATAWRQRKLDFRGATLAQVAAEFNRYNKIQIDVTGTAAGKQLNGVFNADEPQALLDFLAGDETLAFEKRDGAVLIHSR